MTKLLIVESPAKAKTISKYLDRSYAVKASVGHIRDLPKSNKNAIDIAAGFAPRYEIVKGKEAVVAELQAAAKKAEEIILATDPDREGEAIAWHVAQAIGLETQSEKRKAKNIKRIVFHEITKEAVEEALKHPRVLDENLKTAQEARRVLDRLFGYDLSGLIWRKLRYGLSAGRVQSPALRLLAEREREIRAFKPEKYWVLSAIFQNKDGVPIAFAAAERPKTAAAAEKIVALAKEAAWRAGAVTKNEAARPPRPPFITSTLQQAASSRLGFSPSQTMRLAQHLYEAGDITYMRTDSTNLALAAIEAAAQFIRQKYGAEYHHGKNYETRSKLAQEAHEAIRPTDLRRERGGRTSQEQKLYQLIWTRLITSQMTDARLLKTKIEARADKKEVPVFAAQGTVIAFPGWLKADPSAREEETELPAVAPNDPLKLIKIAAEGKETEPPGRYSEAGLIKELEKRGIGRPSTYAPIVKTIIDRGYAEKINRSLKPTDTGEAVSAFLEKHFAKYISDSFTEEMENDLDDIAQGKKKYVKTLSDFYRPFKKEVESKKDAEKITNLGEAKNVKCPLCGSAMVIKLSRTGKFLSCSRFPECKGSLTSEGKPLSRPKETGETCPECQTGRLVERHGRYGAFIACSNYPRCKYVKKDPLISLGADTGVRCPICKEGTMAERRGRYGAFYSCSRYPKCTHLIKNKPTGKICGWMRETGPCLYLMMVGTKRIPERCSDKTCPNYHPERLE